MSASQNIFFEEQDILTINPTNLTEQHKKILQVFLKQNPKIEKLKRDEVLDITIDKKNIAFLLTQDLLKSDTNEYEIFKKVDQIIFLDDSDPLPADPIPNSYVLRRAISNNKLRWVIRYYDEEKKVRILKEKFSGNASKENVIAYLNEMPYRAVPIYQMNADVFLSAGHLTILDSDILFSETPRIIKKINGDGTKRVAELIDEALKEFRISKRIRHLHMKAPIIIGSEIYLVLKNIEGMTLKQKLATQNLTMDEKIDLLLEYLYELQERVHLEKIVHADLKPANAIVKANNKVRIIDFGYSTFVNERHTSPVGSIPYLPPEVANNKEGTSIAGDICTSGLIILEILGSKWRAKYENMKMDDFLKARGAKSFQFDIEEMCAGIFDNSSLTPEQQADIKQQLNIMLANNSKRRGNISTIIDVFENIKLERKLAKISDAEQRAVIKTANLLGRKFHAACLGLTNSAALQKKLNGTALELDTAFATTSDPNLITTMIQEFLAAARIKALPVAINSIADFRKVTTTMIQQFDQNATSIVNLNKLITDLLVILKNIQREEDPNALAIICALEKLQHDIAQLNAVLPLYRINLNDIHKLNHQIDALKVAFHDIDESIYNLKPNNSHSISDRVLLLLTRPTNSNTYMIRELRSIVVNYLQRIPNSPDEEYRRDLICSIIKKLLSPLCDEQDKELLNFKLDVKEIIVKHLQTIFTQKLQKNDRAASTHRLEMINDFLFVIHHLDNLHDFIASFDSKLSKIPGTIGASFYSGLSLRSDLSKPFKNLKKQAEESVLISSPSTSLG